MHILIAGGSGLLGSTLSRRFCAKDHKVTILTRAPEKVHLPRGARAIAWDASTTNYWPESLKPIDAVINLAGEHISGTGLVPKSWTESHKRRMRESRIQSSEVLVKWIKSCESPPKIYIGQSGIDYYQHSHHATDETGKKGEHFLSTLAQDWEESTAGLKDTTLRRIITRTAPVMHPDRPPLLQWLWSSHGFLGGIAGDGEQYVSWIHISDYADILVNMILNESYRGTYNVCAPNPLPYKKLMEAVGKVTGKPIWMKQPAYMIKKIMGEASTLALDSRNVIPGRILEETPYDFQYPEFEPAIQNLSNL